MAPSYEIGNPQKSLVRIPGSGTDRDRKPICLEIAQITSFAKSDAFPNVLRPSPVLLDNVGRLQRLQLPLRIMSPSVNRTPVANISPSNSGAVSRKRALNEEAGNQAKKTNVANDSDNKISNAAEKSTIIKNLLRDKEKLEEENHELRKKIIMFKDLLKNKAKLEEFLVANNKPQIAS